MYKRRGGLISLQPSSRKGKQDIYAYDKIAWFLVGFPSSGRLFSTENGVSETLSLCILRRKFGQLA